MRFSNFLSNTLKILNITNKALPLIRDINPSIKSIKNIIYNNNNKNNSIDKNNVQKELVYTDKRQNYKSNSLTFFK